MSRFINVDRDYVIEIGQIKEGVCIVKKKNNYHERANNKEFFEFIIHNIVDVNNMKRESKYFHVYSEKDEMPLTYKRELAFKLVNQLKNKFHYNSDEVKEEINKTLLRGNDPFNEEFQNALLNNNSSIADLIENKPTTVGDI